MFSNHQKNKVLLSRYFNENTYLVAGMCWKCYNECTDIKIVGINRSFLSQCKKETNAKDLKHCEAEFFELDHETCRIENDMGDLKDFKENQGSVQQNENYEVDMNEFDYSDHKYCIDNCFGRGDCIDLESESQNEINQTLNNFREDEFEDLEVPESDLIHNRSISPIGKVEPLFQSTFPTLLKANTEHLKQSIDNIKELSDVIDDSSITSIKNEEAISQPTQPTLVKAKKLIMQHTGNASVVCPVFPICEEEKSESILSRDVKEHLLQHIDDSKDDLEKKYWGEIKLTPINSSFCEDSLNESEDFHGNKTSFGDADIEMGKTNYTYQEIQDIIGATSQNWCIDSGYFDKYCVSPPKRNEHDSNCNISNENLLECGNYDLLYSKYFLNDCEATQLSQTSEFQGFDRNDLENSNHAQVKMKEVLWKIENNPLVLGGHGNSLPALKELDANQAFMHRTENLILTDDGKSLKLNFDLTIKKEVLKKIGKTILDVKKEIENLDSTTLKKYSDNYNLSPPIWHPPKSPHNLIEEDLYHDPWALLVATIFLNRTSARCARQYIEDFLANYPNPFEVLRTVPSNFEKYFKKLGLQTVRSLQVWKMSHDFVTKDWKDVTELYGVGTYGRDAFNMFCLGNLDVQPEDRYLKIYKAWYEKVYNRRNENFDEKFGGAVGYKNNEWVFDESSGLGEDLFEDDQNQEDDRKEI